MWLAARGLTPKSAPSSRIGGFGLSGPGITQTQPPGPVFGTYGFPRPCPGNSRYRARTRHRGPVAFLGSEWGQTQRGVGRLPSGTVSGGLTPGATGVRVPGRGAQASGAVSGGLIPLRRSAPGEIRVALLEEGARALGEVLGCRQRLLRRHLLLERCASAGFAAASITRFARPTARGAHASSSFAKASVAAASSSAGAIRLANPIRCASRPSITLPVMISSLALPRPTTAGSREQPPTSGSSPTRTSMIPATASSAIVRKSHASASSNAPPSAARGSGRSSALASPRAGSTS